MSCVYRCGTPCVRRSFGSACVSARALRMCSGARLCACSSASSAVRVRYGAAACRGLPADRTAEPARQQAGQCGVADEEVPAGKGVRHEVAARPAAPLGDVPGRCRLVVLARVGVHGTGERASQPWPSAPSPPPSARRPAARRRSSRRVASRVRSRCGRAERKGGRVPKRSSAASSAASGSSSWPRSGIGRCGGGQAPSPTSTGAGRPVCASRWANRWATSAPRLCPYRAYGAVSSGPSWASSSAISRRASVMRGSRSRVSRPGSRTGRTHTPGAKAWRQRAKVSAPAPAWWKQNSRGAPASGPSVVGAAARYALMPPPSRPPW